MILIARLTRVGVERAWAQARRPGPNFRLAVNKLLPGLLNKLEVGSSLKFPVLIEEKLGLEAGWMVFFIGSGSSGLNPQSSKIELDRA